MGWAHAHQEGPTKVMPQQITVSKFANCTSPTSLGVVTVLQATWDAQAQHVKHVNANPLACVGNEDVAAFTIVISNLPTNFAMWVVPQGSSYSSTATVNGNSVAFTLPERLKVIETWALNVGDPAMQPAGCQISVKLKRVTPPP